MPYADSDFFIALISEKDRLNGAANDAYKAYKGNIRTSVVAVAEMLIIAKRFGINPERLVKAILAVAKIPDVDSATVVLAAHYIEIEKVGVFDALHAALCNGEIISSDHVYDRLGIKRIRLE